MYRQVTRANDRDHDRCGDRRGDVAVVPLVGLLSWPIRMWLYLTAPEPAPSAQTAKCTYSAHHSERSHRTT
jgi:hypothetical protein